MILVDTSAILAFLDSSDLHHPAAVTTMRRLYGAGEPLMIQEYALVETIALVQRRLGLGVLRRLVDETLPLADVAWVDPELHELAREALLSAGRRSVSLVDWTSFLVMRRHGIRHAFTFDPDFAAEGFEVLPDG